MDKIKLIMCASLICINTSLWAESTTESSQKSSTESGLISPYGENPNIFHVFAYKTQEGIKSTASRIGNATERGWNKLKPKAKQAEEGIEKTAQTAGQKVVDAKNAVFGNPADGPAPISQQSLEQDSNNNQQNFQQSTNTKTYPISDE